MPPALDPALLAELNDGLVCLSGCARDGLGVRDPNAAAALAGAFGPERFYVELQRPFERGDTHRNALLRDLAEHAGVRTVVTGNVHAHHARRTALQDVLVAIRHNTSLESCERERRGNRESILRAPAELLELFPDDRDAVLRTAEVAAAARVRPDRGARLPLPRLLRRRRPRDQAARPGLRRRVLRALPAK